MTRTLSLPFLALVVASASRPARSAATPSIASLAPSTAIVGSGGLTITVNGANFAHTSVVRWNGSDRPTTYASDSKLTATIAASDLAAVGTPQVTVFTQGGAGGTSNAVAFTVGNPVPTIASVSPSTAIAGGEPMNVVVTGSGFVPTSAVQWNGVARQTVFGGSTKLTASIPASDLASVTTAQISVMNPAPLGGASSSLSLPVVFAKPTIATINPSSLSYHNPYAYTITVDGQNFLPSSVVRWAGSDRRTTWLSRTRLTASLLETDTHQLDPGRVTVAVTLPGAGTRESDPALLPVVYPTPSISSVFPGALYLIDPQPLTIRGTGFTAATVVTVNGHSTHLQTSQFNIGTIEGTYYPTSADTVGPATVRVENPAPGGGAGTATIQFRNRPPTLTALTPKSTTVGGKAFTLVATGGRFVPGMVVRWNGSNRPTTYISASELRASIPLTDLATAGDKSVTVFDPSPLGGTSSPVTFTVLQPAIIRAP